MSAITLPELTPETVQHGLHRAIQLSRLNSNEFQTYAQNDKDSLVLLAGGSHLFRELKDLADRPVEIGHDTTSKAWKIGRVILIAVAALAVVVALLSLFNYLGLLNASWTNAGALTSNITLPAMLVGGGLAVVITVGLVSKYLWDTRANRTQQQLPDPESESE